MPTANGSSHPADGHSPDAIALGTLLRDAREHRGLTLEHVSFETKIPIQVLAALERDDRPGGANGFYQRARIRAYARAVGLDESIVLAEFEREAPPPPPVPAQEENAPAQPWRDERVVLFVVCAAVFVVAGHALWRSPGASSSDGSVAAPPHTVEGARAAIGETLDRPAASSGQTDMPKTLRAAVVPATASVPVAAPPVTALVVTTDPPGARVTVDGIGWGETPVTIRHLPPGTKRLRVTKDGYSAAEQVVNVVMRRSSYVNVELPAIP